VGQREGDLAHDREAAEARVENGDGARGCRVLDGVGLGVVGWRRVGGHWVQYALMPWAMARTSF